MTSVHPAAARGYARSATLYERGRPGYPPDAIALLVDRLAIGPGRRVLDLAAGTGKLTRSLLSTAADVLAVEPLEAMRRTFAVECPGVPLVDGTAESIPVDDGSVDVVTVAQAFHWFDAPRAVVEIHRVLRPDGGLGLLWNVRDEGNALQAALTEIMEPYRERTPSHRTGAWREAFEQTALFSPFEERSFGHEQATTPDGVVDRVLSISFIATLPDPERRDVAARIRSVVGRESAPVLRYRTDVYVTRRR